MNEVAVIETQATQNINSNSVIIQEVASEENNNKQAEIEALINNYLSQKTYSFSKLQIVLQNDHNINMEDFNTVCRRMGIDDKVLAKRRAEELISNNLNNEKTILTTLGEERFGDRDVQVVIEELKQEGKIVN